MISISSLLLTALLPTALCAMENYHETEPLISGRAKNKDVALEIKGETSQHETYTSLPQCSYAELTKKVPSLVKYVRRGKIEKLKKFREHLQQLQPEEQENLLQTIDIGKLQKRYHKNHNVISDILEPRERKRIVTLICSLIAGAGTVSIGDILHNDLVGWTGVGIVAGSLFIGATGIIIDRCGSIPQIDVYSEINHLQNMKQSLAPQNSSTQTHD